ncbi:MAG: outer membrane lipoprotein LolB [Pseudomonadales bacterium]|nr:outer membrane lipoprotein LolB [Pseudomonadales bacterium]NIX09510.1 outer membrane lipoprotein LolB [Pseudomonadales bacterium]
MSVCTSCTSISPPVDGPADFELRGKAGVVDGAESFSARFIWRQYGSAFSIDLWGPLGQGRVRLDGDERRLAIVDGSGAVLSEGPHADVMRAHLGWSLPLDVLPSWVLGTPGDGTGAGDRQYDDDGRLVGFEQLDWSVAYARHSEVQTLRGPRWLPGRITATRGDYRVRLSISDWML